MKVELDERKLMNSMDRTRRIGLLMLYMMAIGEGVGLIGIALHLDFSDPLHRLLLFITILIYFTLGGVLLALFFFSRTWILQVLKAIELLASTEP